MNDKTPTRLPLEGDPMINPDKLTVGTNPVKGWIVERVSGNNTLRKWLELFKPAKVPEGCVARPLTYADEPPQAVKAAKAAQRTPSVAQAAAAVIATTKAADQRREAPVATPAAPGGGMSDKLPILLAAVADAAAKNGRVVRGATIVDCLEGMQPPTILAAGLNATKVAALLQTAKRNINMGYPEIDLAYVTRQLSHEE